MRKKHYKTPPVLLGYNYSPEDAQRAGAKDRLLALRIETSNACNLRCIYCNGASGRKMHGEISFAAIKKAVAEAKDLGAESIIVIGGGEPTVYPHFISLIRYIHCKGLVPVVITNGLKLSLQMTRFLYDENASVLFKLDSLDAKTQDYLAGKKGAYKTIMQGMEKLFKVGFNKASNGKLRCGASFVVTKVNYDEIASIWRFCRKHCIYPNLEEFIPRGRGLQYSHELNVAPIRIKQLKEKLLELDQREYGYSWLVYAPLPGHGCLQHLYSIYLACDGYVRPCADVDIKFFNVREMGISKIVQTPFFKYLRTIDRHIQGKCQGCEYGKVCVGCRGKAFNVGIQEGLDMYNAISREDPVCWKQ